MTGQTFPSGQPREVDIRSTLQATHLGAGWSWTVRRRLHLQASLAFWKCVAASTDSDVAPGNRIQERQASRIEAELNACLDGIYTRYVMSPVLRVIAGTRFGRRCS